MAAAYVVNAVEDTSRPPADTLAFAGVNSGMTVAELFPDGGYYSRMLSDIVGPKGRVYGIENAGRKGAVKVDQIMVAEPGRSNVTLQVQPFGQFALPTKVDPVWITQNYHDLHIAKYDGRPGRLQPPGVPGAEAGRDLSGHRPPGQSGHDRSPDRRPAPHRESPGDPRGTAAGFRLVAEGAFLRGEGTTTPCRSSMRSCGGGRTSMR